MMQVSAAVLRDLEQPLRIEQLDLSEPQAGEVLVRLVATGVCQTDISMTHGMPVPVPRPFVLGHEGAGVIEKVGPGTPGREPGQHVVMSFEHCGKCRHCSAGHPAYCERFFVNFSGRRSDGSPTLCCGEETVGGNFFGQSSFATHAVAKASSVIPVPADLPLEIMGPLGCGIQTGAGAVMNVLKPEPGSSIAIFGAGAVGLSALLAARLMGCARIVVVDLNDERLKLAQELGATDVINAAAGKPTPQIVKITGGGVDYSVEASGAMPAIAGAIECLAVRGTCAIVGGGPPVSLNVPHLMTGGRSIKGVGMGDCVPSVMIPRLVELYRLGSFPFDRLITFYRLDQVNDAIADSLAGRSIKPVLRM
jgi:aryl-alcohol dehydrogenase